MGVILGEVKMVTDPVIKKLLKRRDAHWAKLNGVIAGVQLLCEHEFKEIYHGNDHDGYSTLAVITHYVTERCVKCGFKKSHKLTSKEGI
jgi:hypothetical protein